MKTSFSQQKPWKETLTSFFDTNFLEMSVCFSFVIRRQRLTYPWLGPNVKLEVAAHPWSPNGCRKSEFRNLKKRWSWGGQNWDDFNIAIPLLGLSSGAQLLSVLMKGQAASCPISHFPTPPGGSRGWYWNFHFQVADISKLRITCIYWSSHPFVSLSLASIGIIVQGAILSCPGLPAFIVAASKSIVLYQPEWSLKNIDHITLSPTPPSVLNSIGLLLHLILKIWFFFITVYKATHNAALRIPLHLTHEAPASLLFLCFLTVLNWCFMETCRSQECFFF